MRKAGMVAAGMAALLVGSLVVGPHAARAAETTQEEAWLGVYTQTLTSELREGLGYNGAGALVSRVVPDGPADKAGVQKGDVIVGFNTTTIASATDLSRAVRAAKSGQNVSVRIVRDGSRRTLTAKLAARPEEGGELEWSEAPDGQGEDNGEGDSKRIVRRFKLDGSDHDFSFGNLGDLAMLGMGRGRLGVRIESLNPDLAGYFPGTGGSGALVVEVLKDTPAERAGLKAGDVITKAGDKSIKDSEDLVSALRDEEKHVRLTVIRKGSSRFIESDLSEAPRVMRFRGDGPLGMKDGDIRVLRDRVRGDDDMRREIDQLRQELRELKQKLEGRNRN